MPKHNPDRTTDRVGQRTMTDEDVEANALADPDNPPLTAEQLASLPRRARVFVMRRALKLTQEAFSARYGIPLGTLRDWEQGRAEPDAAARAYLRVIANDPEGTARAYAGRDAA